MLFIWKWVNEVKGYHRGGRYNIILCLNQVFNMLFICNIKAKYLIQFKTFLLQEVHEA